MSVGEPSTLRAIRTTYERLRDEAKTLFGGKSRNSDCTARLHQSGWTRWAMGKRFVRPPSSGGDM